MAEMERWTLLVAGPGEIIGYKAPGGSRILTTNPRMDAREVEVVPVAQLAEAHERGVQEGLEIRDSLREQLADLNVRFRHEVDARRMVLHDRALPLTDEQWADYLAGIPEKAGR
jgi:hypothetical protein